MHCRYLHHQRMCILQAISLLWCKTQTFCDQHGCCPDWTRMIQLICLLAESLEGICVRHNDDCTPVCMPRGDEPQKRRVCSKVAEMELFCLCSCASHLVCMQGCNQMLKVAKSANSKDAAERKAVLNESQLYDIIICQVPIAAFSSTAHRIL